METTLMEKYAFKMQLNPGCETEYRKRHDEIWPELTKLLQDAGISESKIEDLMGKEFAFEARSGGFRVQGRQGRGGGEAGGRGGRGGEAGGRGGRGGEAGGRGGERNSRRSRPSSEDEDDDNPRRRRPN